MMKKKYITPQMETIGFDVNPIMNQTSMIEGDEIIDPDDQGAANHRGDWNNIWENM